MPFDVPVFLGSLLVTALLLGGVYLWGRTGESLLTLPRVAGTFAASALLITPLTFTFGTSWAKSDLMGYNEYWSGLEKSAQVEVTTCTRDGSCRHEYDCDPYTVPVTKTRTVSDGKGGTRTESYTDYETRYHECPYVTHEYTYTVTDTMGESYSYGDHLFPEHPEEHRWRSSSWHSLPRVEAGVPPAWTAAKARIDGGNPGGTTKRKGYKNYVLATQEAVYRKHSDLMEDYVKKGVLPKLTDTIRPPYFADKVYLVGATVADAASWQEALQRFNGYFGSQKQGDLHLVLVDAKTIPAGEKAAYTQALEAYWQSKALGKNTLSKNGLALVVGVEGGRVAWTDAFTGMPEGNEALLQSLRSLQVPTFTPAGLLDPKAGALVKPLLGAEGYKRVEMANYKYLEDAIVPSTGAHLAMGLVANLLTALTLGGVLWAAGRSSSSSPARRRHPSRASTASIYRSREHQRLHARRRRPTGF